MGPAGVRRPPGRPARRRHLPPGEPGAPRPGRERPRRRGLARHAGRHGLAHHDDQRARRARVGRRRDRGRGRDARAADVPPAARRGRCPGDGRAPRGHDRDRPRPHADPDAPRARRGGAGSSSSSATVSPPSPSPIARRCRTCVPSTGPRPPTSRSTTQTLEYLRFTGGGADRSRRAIHEGAGAVPRPMPRPARVHGDAGPRSRRRSSPRWRVLDGRRIASPCRTCGRRSSTRSTPPRARPEADRGRSIRRRGGQRPPRTARSEDGPRT